MQRLLVVALLPNLIEFSPKKSNPINQAGFHEGEVLSRPLNGTEIDEKYQFDDDIHASGTFADVYLGNIHFNS